jgi:hypothetical protein
MTKPRLTKPVMDGLLTLSGVVGAGQCADILGNDYEQLDAEGKQSWDNIRRAMEWVSDMAAYRRAQREGKT